MKGQRLVKPAKCECELLDDPISPCEILPNGFPGTMTINGTLYAVSIIGYLPPIGEPVIEGYRLTKDNGEAHDICLVVGRLECSCGDWMWRRAAQQTRELADCKHCKAVNQLLLRPVDQRQSAYAS